MRFHPPFDDVQYQAAVKLHSELRRHLSILRAESGSRPAEIRGLLKLYRDAIQDFGRELLKPRDRINSARLNEMEKAATKAAIDYLVARRIHHLE